MTKRTPAKPEQTPAAPTAPVTTPADISTPPTITSNNEGPTIVDNTDAVEVEQTAVETEEVELFSGLTQVNYV